MLFQPNLDTCLTIFLAPSPVAVLHCPLSPWREETFNPMYADNR